VSKKGDSKARSDLWQPLRACYWVHGFSATSIADIAVDAGCPQCNMCYSFRTKAELALAVADCLTSMKPNALVIEAEAASPDPRWSAAVPAARTQSIPTAAGLRMAANQYGG